MIEKLFELLTALAQIIPVVNKWFTTPTSKKIEEDKQALDKDEEEYRKTGRPKP